MISDKDVSDHHAIIPTMEIEKADIKGLPLGERNLFLLVCCKLLCASAEPYVYEAVTVTSTAAAIPSPQRASASSPKLAGDRPHFRTSLKEKPADGDGGTLPDFTEGRFLMVRRLLLPSISPSRRSPIPKIPSCPLWRTQARMVSPTRRSGKGLARLRPGRLSSKSWWLPDLWNARARADPHKSRYQPCHDSAGAADLSHADSGMGTEIDGDCKRRR